MIVMKFGGTSVATPENIQKVVRIVADARQNEGAAAVVCSAFGGVTNMLIRLSKLATERSDEMAETLEALKVRHREAITALVAEEYRDEASEAVEAMLADLSDVLQGVYLLREASARSVDFIMSFGERLCARIVSYAMRTAVPQTEFLDARKVVRTDGAFGLAQVDWDVTRDNIRNYFNSHSALQIVTGFIASTEDKHTTTLGRGGSDYTASLFGAALECKEIQIWTDVSGVLTSDPRKVSGTQPVTSMSYEEAMEVAHFGAKVIYPPTMAPAMKAGIPLRIKNTFEPEAEGTLIGKKSHTLGGVCAITSIDSVAMGQLTGSGLIGVAGSASRLFGALARSGISVILISQASSEHSICFAVKPQEAEAAKEAVSAEFEYEILKGQVDNVTMEKELSIIALVGEGMRERPGITGRTFAALGRNRINVEAITQGSSEINISFVVKRSDETRALRILHEAFFVSRRVHRVFLVGTGLIGKTLLNQLNKLQEEKPALPVIRVCGMANSRKMAIDFDGIDTTDPTATLEAGDPLDTAELMAQMKTWPDTILVDCTAGEAIPALYKDALSSGISVVTPNKVANTSSYKQWRHLQELKRRASASFYYEANVGAGLPVIGPLRSMVGSGDKVLRIEAILSGTLSYLFNTFSAGDSFTDLLRAAREKGFTEPDPRDDLSGTDVARKILILARETGHELELSDVEVENLVPEDLRDAPSVDAFFQGLETQEQIFADRLAAANAEGKALRYIATLEDGKARVGLQAVGPEHPCHGVTACDNIVSFTTQRYNDTPMVIKGPGAGAEVTAAQCLMEILRIASRNR